MTAITVTETTTLAVRAIARELIDIVLTVLAAELDMIGAFVVSKLCVA